jgi:hypothetical protein
MKHLEEKICIGEGELVEWREKDYSTKIAQIK